MQECIPDELLSQIISFLPKKSFLPVSNVSKQFHRSWFISDMRHPEYENNYSFCCQTDPLQLGSLYDVHWNASLSRQKTLRAPLLSYFVSCGWTKSSSFNRLMLEAASRGDVTGMQFMIKMGFHASLRQDTDENNALNPSQTKIHLQNICTTAGAAGRLATLEWLLAEGCPWNPSEIFREAAENNEYDVMDYTENRERSVSKLPYGDGLPY
mmetsp:Transcript_10987/g.12563  ORF Transcript_10987/g.12563 Transcript_10987/m.12563 type:complete len:211 (+) Transcript_10987:234-866(+)